MRVLAAAITVAACALILEGGARLWYAGDFRVSTRLNLHPYQHETPCGWGLRPGYDDGKIRVNTHGYRGPELRTDGTYRVLVIGDSCSFGLADFGWVDVFRERTGWDVVNAAVEGHGAAQARCRLPEFQALKPDLVLVYIGWNSLYMDHEPAARLAAERLTANAWLFVRERYGFKAATNWHPVPVDYAPSFMDDMTAIVDAFPNVVIFTLPGLFRTDVAPSPEALAMGHTPYFTSNAYVLAAMAEAYNYEVRGLGVRVIDLDKIARSVEHEPYFFDSVHMTLDAQRQLGKYLADEFSSTAR